MDGHPIGPKTMCQGSDRGRSSIVGQIVLMVCPPGRCERLRMENPPSKRRIALAWCRHRGLPLIAGAALPFVVWSVLEVLRGHTWGLLGSPLFNLLVMLGMSSVYATLMAAGAIAIDLIVPVATHLRDRWQFFAAVVASVVGLGVLSLLPLNESGVLAVAGYCLGAALSIVAVVRALAGKFVSSAAQDRSTVSSSR